MLRVTLRRIVGLALAGGLAACAAGCSGQFASYITEERDGNITVQVINNTRYRAAFSFGSWDSLERDPPGAVTLQQQRLEGRSSTSTITVACRRNVAIGTEEFLQRVLDTNADDTANFDADAFVAGVSFSDAPADSTAAALPTVGTALGREVLLGVHFTCGDLLIFILEEDATAQGGFRIDFRVLPDEEADR